MKPEQQAAALGEFYIASNPANRPAGAQLPLSELVIAGRKEIVFIASDAPDIEALARGLGAGREVVILDATRDGLRQIAEALEGRSGIDALHIVSHGRQGSVDLGSLMLGAGDLPAHGADLQAIGRVMAEGGDILLYGCDVGAGEQGLALVSGLAAITGADVAASSDPTGAAALGGDWVLEVRSGDIDTPAAVDPVLAASYQRILAGTGIATANVDFGERDNFVFDGSSYDPDIDVVYRVNNQAGYLLKIDGATRNIANYDYGYLASDSFDGSGETAITFSFVNGQIFTPKSISVANFENGTPSQKLVFTGYDTNGNPVGSPQILNTADFPHGVPVSYTTLKFSGLSGIARLTVKADPASNDGKMIYLVFDDVELADIKPASQPAPAVTSVSSGDANGAYKAGDTIQVTVSFDRAVFVDSTGGVPTLRLETGSTDQNAAYVSGSGTSTLVFSYTVQAGDTSADLDYTGTAALALNGATIKASDDGANAALALPTPGDAGSLGASKALVIDTTAPAAPPRPVLAAGSDSGTQGDGITSRDKPTITGSAETGATVRLYDSDGATEIGSAVATGGAWSITPSASLSQGAHTLTVKATDAAGNVSAASQPLNIAIDLTPPTLAITSDRAMLAGAGDSATITFTFSEDPGASFTRGSISVEGGSLGAISGSGLTRSATFTPTPGFEGSGRVFVGAGSYQDVAGNNGGGATTPWITIDTRAPAAPQAPVLAAGSDSGNPDVPGSDTDRVTNVTQPTFQGGAGSAEAGANIRVYDGITLIATTTARADGSWSVASAIALPEGARSITAIATDMFGNAGTASAALAVTIDVTPPRVPAAPDLAAASDSGMFATDDITRIGSPTFGGAAGSVDAGVTVKLYDTDGREIASTVALGDGSWSVASSTLAEGAHTITARAVDAAGNASAASTALTLTIDRTAPAAQASGARFSEDTGNSSTDLVTSIAGQTISGALSAVLAEGERVEVSLDNGNSWSPASVDGLAWSLGATLAGSGILQVRVTDLAGNESTRYTKAYVLDTIAPVPPSTPDLVAGSDSGQFDNDDITGIARPTFSGIAEAGATVTLYDGATPIGSGVATGGVWSITSLTPLAQGSHAITARATDAAGNTSGPSLELTIQVITDAPTTMANALRLASDTGSVDGDLVTRVAAQELLGKLNAPLAAGERVEVSIGGGAWQNATATVGATDWSLSATLGAGTNPIAVRVTNAIGNSGDVYTRDYTLDTIAPTVTITSNVATLKAGDTATITFTFSEDPGDTFSWNGSAGDVIVQGGTLSALSGTGSTRTATFTPDDGVDNGTATFEIAAGAYADLAGNAGQPGAAIMLHYDTLAPGVPSSLALDAGSDTGVFDNDRLTTSDCPTFTGTADTGATVILVDGAGNTIGSGVATGGAWSIVPTGALPEGTHTISARTRDAAGNLSAVSEALQVRIDKTAPTVSITASVAQLKIGDSATITFTFSEDPGTTFTHADVQVEGGTLGALSGAGLTRSAVFTPTAGIDDGVAVITIGAGAYTDSAGNVGGAGAAPSLRFDTLAPIAPSTPDLDAASDTGVSDSDNLTTDTTPTFRGTAPAGATIRLYDGATEIGSVLATGGAWSITSSILGAGAHSISAVAVDAAGNRSAPSQALALTIEAAPTPSTPTNPPTPTPPLVDGMPVTSGQATLPGGVRGATISVPIVTGGRLETDGSASLADIPLAAANGATQLLAQLPVGYGLSGSGASVGPADALAFLIASIKAATPNHAASDQGHLVNNGASYLAGLAYGSLLVQTVKPVSTPDADGALVLRAFDPAGRQQTALVIDTAGLAGGARLEVVDVDFAAVVGKGEVLARGDGVILAGDGASQHFTVGTGASSQVFAGGGADVLSFGLPADPGSATARTSARIIATDSSTLLHGGQAQDTATFSGARADFDVVAHNGYVVVSSKAAPQSTALVVNVEQLQFSDGVVAIDNGAHLTTLAGMYQTVLGRQADLGGFEFWADRHDEGVSWGAIALAMIDSNERLAGQAGFNGEAAHDVGLLYQALFDRAADAQGMAHWLGVMEDGMDLEQVAGYFVASAEMVGHQRAATDWDFFV